LDKLFTQMHDFRNRPLKNIAVLSSVASPLFLPASKETFAKMNDAINALFLSAVAENNSLNAVASDNFHLITQNFTPGDDGWGITDGSYIQITVGGLKLTDAGVRLPPRMSHLNDFHYDAELLDGCIRCLMNGEDSLRKRIFSSLQWVAYSYDNDPRFPYHSRILLLMVAFEILGAYPGSFTAMTFAKWLDETWNTPEERKTLSLAKSKPGSYSPLGWWGMDFYSLRNDIVHNKKDINELRVFDEHGREYFKTGFFVFTECVKELLSKQGLYKKSENAGLLRAWRLSERDSQDNKL